MKNNEQVNKRLEWDGFGESFIRIVNTMLDEVQAGYQFSIHTVGPVARLSLAPTGNGTQQEVAK